MRALIDEAKEDGLFLVPVGELEGWLEFCTARKSKWIVTALDAISAGKASKKLKEFVAQIISSMGEPIADRAISAD